ncbi:O-antigen biosynthesis protein [Erwinia rhapontici]|uniref:O-antigen biosynthesis protein n=1 Tax=Erwinia rhapontici TaxID=55212 RepID=A0ABN6DL42_ERWRD|nr:glycosyltransferase [Erwinia rhapontici]BCQ35483.1 O-antigen biosynthesis protein [Erwinia rhapontici]BCQ40387.1 O-antigen biosynthesis protein [Erwinia rhapontici]
MTQTARVSIIILAQYPMWLNEALDSALAQDYPHCEIIIADCSGDKLVGQHLAARPDVTQYPITHLVFEKNQRDSYEVALRAAQGEYIKLLTHAERLEADCVSRLVAGLQRYPQCRVAASKRQRIDPRGEPLPDIASTAPLNANACIINGRDFLRSQAQISYSLLGELTASLLYRDDLLALISDENTLFSLNGEALSGVEGLVVYSKLLAQTDLLWFPQPLCCVRFSAVYRQPHQIDSDEDISKAREKVLQSLKAQPWYETGTAVDTVQLTELDQPDRVEAKNLLSTQQQYVVQDALNAWNGQRSLQPFQQKHLQQLAAAIPQPVNVAVVITVTAENCQSLSVTLDSLVHQGMTTLRLNPVVIGAVGDLSCGFPCYAAQEEDRLAVINQLIQQHDDGWFIFVDAGTHFQPSGLIALSTTLPQADSLLAIYADEYFYLGDEPSGMVFRPDFNLDLFLSSPKTMAQHWLFRRELLVAAEGFDLNYPQAAELDLIVKMIESQGLNVAGHLAEPLLTARLKSRAIVEDAAIIERHLNNRGYPQAQIALDSFYNYRLRYQHPTQPKVSIIILANWHLPSLISCVTTLLEKTHYLNYELLIVADGQESAERDSWLHTLAGVDPQRIRVLHYQDSYQHGPMANLAAEQATGDYLVLMHCELAMIDGEWLDNLLNHGQRPEVAIVGGKQLTSENKVRHAGYILGMNGAAGDAFRGMDDSHPSQQGRLQLDQNYSAVSGDFMLIRKAVFFELGGFDSANQLYDDVDLCLRARSAGYMTVWTPYARVLRPAARSNPFPGETVHSSSKLKQQEEDKLFARWMPVIANDPAFNANMSLRSRHFDIEGDSLLSWRPAPRENVPTFLAHNADMTGCGHYRMMKPFEAMRNEGLAEGHVSMTLLNISEIGRFKPDSLIIQRRYSPAFHNWIERTGKLHNVFKVFELDDYILNVPIKHNNRQHFKQEITGQLRKSLSFFDRFVVSTAPLAEAMSSMHPQILVVKNRLPADIWEPLHSLRNQGKKPRVGWAGGSSHRGDLEMIVDIIKEFAHDVEWVFFGMCPEKLRPYIHEYHQGVDISLYPEKLASLNLDLALAPVEDNIFNACKSNLRLLEYGVCGIPVICSNVACYTDDDLPVTRVNNRFIDWRDAIRMHLADQDASARMGAELQTAVRRDWMLTGNNVVEWATAWSAN